MASSSGIFCIGTRGMHSKDTPLYLLPPVRELDKLQLWEYRFRLHFKKRRKSRLVVLRNNLFPKVGSRVRLQEALTMDFIARNTTIPVPKVLDVFSINGTVHIIQEFIDGSVLEDIWHRLSTEERHSSMIQLQDCLDQLRALNPPHTERVQAVDGSGLIDDRIAPGVWGPFDTHVDFHSFLNYDFLSEHPERYPRLQEPLAKISQKIYRSVFSHGDLGPHNILWKKDGKIVIIDWERSGWFPEYWDYTRAYVARGDMKSWWNMFQERAVRYDDEVELASRISEYFENI